MHQHALENLRFVRFTKVSKNKNDIRTNVTLGLAVLPRVGDRFVLFARSLSEPAAIRVITTTPVFKHVLDATLVSRIQTQNSVYRIELLDECEESNSLRALIPRNLRLLSERPETALGEPTRSASRFPAEDLEIV